MFTKQKNRINNLSPTAKGYLLVIIVLILGIIFRWDDVSKGIIKGFKFFSK